MRERFLIPVITVIQFIPDRENECLLYYFTLLVSILKYDKVHTFN